MKMTFGQRLKIARELADLTQDGLCQKAGVGQGQISKLERNERERSTYAVEFAVACGVSPLWLAMELGPMIPAASHAEDPDDQYATCQQFQVEAAMGDGALNQDYVELRGNLKFKTSFLQEEGIKAENGQVIYAKGDSMSPTIPDGSVVLIDRGNTSLRHGKVFLVLDTAPEAGLRIKRLLRERDGWLISSDNPDRLRYPEEPFAEGQHFIVGRAAWFGSRI